MPLNYENDELNESGDIMAARGTNLTTSPKEQNDGDDDISITSSVDDMDDEKEWPVNQILADAVIDGEVQYLIDWEGFPLHNATWEPRDNLSDDMIESWEATKGEIKRGKKPALGITDWKKAMIQHLTAKFRRHELRNTRRRRRGLETTTYDCTLEELLQDINSYPMDAFQSSSTSQNPNLASQFSPHKDKDASDEQLGTSDSPKGTTRALPRTADAFFVKQSVSQRRSSLPVIEQPSNTIEPCPILRRTATADTGSGTTIMKRSTSTLASRFARSRDSPTINIFAGGRVRKPRETLDQAAVNPNKAPKIVKKRHQNILYKRSRDRDGVTAPSRIPSNLINLDYRTRAPGISSLSLLERVGTEDSLGLESMDLDDPSCLQPPTRNEESSNDKPEAEGQLKTVRKSSIQVAQGKDKPKRSVRWEDQVDNDCSIVSIRPSREAVGGNNILPASAASLAKNLSCQDSQSRFDLTKRVRITNSPLQTSLTFCNLPTDQKSSWLQAFKAQETVHFTHMCTAMDYIIQVGSGGETEGKTIVADYTAAGTVSFHSDTGAIHTLVENMNNASLGIVCHNGSHCVLIYPARCENWHHENLPRHGDKAIDADLLYTIFTPGMYFSRPTLIRNNDMNASSESDVFCSPRNVEMVSSSFYSKLRVAPRSQPGGDSIFLLFPPSAGQEAVLLSHWLRASKPNCELLSSLFPGHWQQFLKTSHGVIIIHEDALPKLYHLDRLFEILHSRSSNHQFWVWERPLEANHEENVLTDQPHAILSLRRVLLCGIAILVTQSFLLSRPVQAYNLVKWFYKGFVNEPDTFRHGRLVVAYGVCEWLLDLATGKTLDQVHSADTSDEYSKEVRLRTWKLLSRMSSPVDDEELSAPLQFGPASLDVDDEQSLVNWFGWWTLTQLDNFRQFTVICSDDAAETQFAKLVTTTDFLVPSQAHQNQTLSSSEKVPLQLVQSVEGKSFITFLDALIKSNNSLSYCPATVYRFPVTRYEQDYIGTDFRTLGNWFTYFWQHLSNVILDAPTPQYRGFKNTYIGFFYTSNTTNASADGQHEEFMLGHPWLVVYRPKNVHIKPWKESELFIWDCLLSQDTMSQSCLYEQDLSAAQQELIRVVRHRGEKLPLRSVWAGGLNNTTQPYTHPVDMTLDRIKVFTSDLKTELPIREQNLVNRGWKHVLSSTAKSASAAGKEATSCLPDGEKLGESKLIFGGPIAPNMLDPTSANRLAQSMKSRERGARTLFLYTATMTWYRKQLESGQGLGHLYMAAWKDVFERYAIDIE